jgi:hypothetical protein
VAGEVEIGGIPFTIEKLVVNDRERMGGADGIIGRDLTDGGVIAMPSSKPGFGQKLFGR